MPVGLRAPLPASEQTLFGFSSKYFHFWNDSCFLSQPGISYSDQTRGDGANTYQTSARCKESASSKPFLKTLSRVKANGVLRR
jgi:hypothetical protein